jgi:tetratricopeptide (TPR) repeat protein
VDYCRILPLILLFLPLQAQLCRAEKIHYTNGEVENAPVVSHAEGSFFIRHGDRTVGVSEKDVRLIENDDGTPSKYGYGMFMELIQLTIKRGDYREAARLSGLLLNAIPSSRELRYLRALLSQRVGDYAQASMDYSALIGSKAADARIYNNLGAIYAEKKDFDRALALFHEAQNKEPGNIETRNNLANLFLQTGRYDLAIDEYGAVKAREPENLKVLHGLALAYLKKGDYPKAREQWEKVLSIDSNDGDAKHIFDFLEKKGRP